MSNPFQVSGGQPTKPTRYAPIFTNRFFTGLWTQRNPLREGAVPYLFEKFYAGSRNDSLIAGVNVELSNKLTLQRRPGLSVYNSQNFPAANSFYEFRQFTTSAETISVILDGQDGVIYDATGPSNKTTIFTKASSAGPAYFQGVGNILYFGDGAETQKYLQVNGAWTTQNWGISLGAAAVTDPVGTGSDVVVTGSGSVWANPGNITGNDGNFATTTLTPTITNSSAGPNNPTGASDQGGGTTWQNLAGILGAGRAFSTPPGFGVTSVVYVTGFQFNIPANAVVKGISVAVSRWAQAANAIVDNSVKLLKAGAPVGTSQALAPAWPTIDTAANYGSSTNLWGATWLASDINNNSGFGIAFQAKNTSAGTLQANLDSVTITVYYSFQTSGTLYSDLLQGTNFGFALSSSSGVGGIQVTIKGQQGANPSNSYLSVYMMKAGKQLGTAKVFQLPASNGNVVLGTSTDLWGTTWSYNDINQTNFGISIEAINNGTTAASWSVDYVTIAIYPPGGQPVVTVSGSAGTMSAVNGGYKYTYCYCNSAANTVSSSAVPSTATGNFASKLNCSFTVSASGDPQVNQIRIFRTTDGGATLFEIPTSPYSNTSQTITDSATDAQLQTLNIAPGVHDNDPPPSGFTIPAYHLGRVFGAAGNTVYYSQAAGATTLGNAAEAFPPLNFFTYPAKVTRLMPTAVGLLVFTASDVYVVLGDGTVGGVPLFSVPFCRGLGLLSYNAFTVNGTIIYLMTSDSQVVGLDPSSGISEIGFPIGDVLEAFSPTGAYLTWHVKGSQDKALYASDGLTGWYRMNPTAAPETGIIWSPQAQITGGCSAVQSVETTPGIRSLLVAPATGTSGPILQRDLTVYTDNGTAYGANAAIGNIVLAQPGQIAEINFIAADCTAVGSYPTIGVLLDEIGGSFTQLTQTVTDPPQALPSVTLNSNRAYLAQSGTQQFCRHLQIQFAWPAEAFKNELLTYTIFGAYQQEK